MRVSFFVRCTLAAAVTISGAAQADPLTDAKSLVGKSCTHMFGDRGKDFPGYTAPKGFLTVTLGNDGWIFPMDKQGARFAFLITGLGDQACKVSDVVALPDAKHADAWFQCHEREAMVEGFGMRLSGHKEIVGWWIVDHGKIKAMPDTKGVICQQPETGD
jgi:hypothetical protein